MNNKTYNNLQALARAARGKIKMIYLHWTAGQHITNYIERADYHICILGDGRIEIECDDLTELRTHTWHRNTGAIGIALCCGLGATANNGYNADFGLYPPTPEQITAMAEVIAVLSRELVLPIDKNCIMTHCEAALLDGYGPYSGDPETRWDLWYIDDPGTKEKMQPGGDVLRGLANWFKTMGIPIE